MHKSNWKKKLVALGINVVWLFNSMMCGCEATERAPYFGYQLYGGLGEYGTYDRYWYFNYNDMTMLIYANAAMDSWMDTSVNQIASYISFERTTVKMNASIIISAADHGEECGYNGYTSFTYNNYGVFPEYQSWDTAYVTYNTTNGNINEYDSASIIAVYAHEIGHAFGLDENNSNQNSIMCQWNHNRSVYVPTSNDIWSAVCIYTK